MLAFSCFVLFEPRLQPFSHTTFLAVTHLWFLSNKAKGKRKMNHYNEAARRNQIPKENQIFPLIFLLSICPWCICCFFVLGYLSESEREKNSKVLDSPSVHHFRMYHQWDRWRGHKHAEPCTHTRMHTDTESLAHEENQNVECPRDNTTAQNTSTHCQWSVYTRERKGGVRHNCRTKGGHNDSY